MKLKRSIVSLLLTATVLMSCMIIPVFSASAATETGNETGASSSADSVGADNSTAYNLPSKVQDGNIFHAFTWRFTDVSKYMKEIAGQGFGSVQVSPVTPTAFKADGDNAGSYMVDWWKYYQPIDFTLGNGLGTAADFKKMCEVAKSYGVKVIVDIVANHMAQGESGGAFTKSKQIIDDLRLDTNAWHKTNAYVSDSSRADMTQKSLSGLPDLNTGSTKVQNYVKDLLKSCLDNGADGFRFDAAKHIELPTSIDGSTGSDFWPNITSYAKSIKPDVYIYGEILNTAGTSYSNYTKYINVTDNGQGNEVRSAAKSTSANANLVSYNCSGAAASNLVSWVESHDTFCDKTSTTLTHQQILLGWGIIGARKDASSLYFCRPEHEKVTSPGFIDYDELIGGPGNTLWQDKTVAEVNKFRNNFVGQSENASASGSQFFVQRGTSGMVVVNLGSSNASINYSCSMANGTYKDQVSGGTFTVSGGKLTGTVPAKSVAVIYNKTKTTPITNVSLGGKKITSDKTTYTGNTTGYYTNNYNFTSDTATLTFALQDATSGTYSVSGGKAVSFSGSTNVVIGKNVPSNTSVTVKVTATDGTRTTNETYVFVKKLATEKLTVYFDATGYETWSEFCVFAKNTNGSAIKAYPGFKMTKVEGNIYKADITGATGSVYVKFNEGNVKTGLDGRTVPPTVINFGTAATPANREKGGFLLNGSMIWQNGEWKDYGYSTNESPVDPTDPTKPTETTPPTKPTETTPPTKPTETTPPTPGEKYMLGDADMKGSVNVADVLLMQQHIASMTTLKGTAYLAADVNQNGKIETADVLEIQKYLAGMGSVYKIGQYINGGPVTPTNPPVTNPPVTDPPVTNPPVTSPEPGENITLTLNKPASWGTEIYAYLFSGAGNENAAWPGEAMQANGSTYTITVPANTFDQVIFVDTPGTAPDNEGGTKTIVRMQTAKLDVQSTPYTISETTVTGSNLGFTPTHVYCYNPDVDNFAETGAWPGLAITGSSITVPAGAYTKAIFSNGASQKELDIEGSTPEPPTTPPTKPEQTDPPQPGGDVTITLNKPANWGSEVYAYVFNDSGSENAAWPGEPMQSSDGTTFTMTVPADSYDSVIFVDSPQTIEGTDGASKIVARMQSASMALQSGTYEIEMVTVSASNLGFTPTHVYCYNPDPTNFAETGVWPGLEISGSSVEIPAGVYTKAIFNNGTSQKEVDIEGTDPGPGPGPDPSGETITIYFTDSFNWTASKGGIGFYAWKSGGDTNNGAWPGEKLTTPLGKNGFGQNVYKITVDLSKYDCVIFNSTDKSNTVQSADIKLTAADDGKGFYVDSSKPLGNNKYNYGTYLFDPSDIK